MREAGRELALTPRVRALARTFARLTIVVLFLSLTPVGAAGAEIELRAGVRHLSGSDAGDTTILDLEVARSGPRHRFSLDVAALSTRVSSDRLQIRLGRLRAAVRAGRISRERLRQRRAELVPRRSEGVADAIAGWSAVLHGGDARQSTVMSIVEIKIPIADFESGLGSGAWDGRLGVFGERRFWSSTLTAEVGFNHLGEPSGIDLRDVFDIGLGLEGRESRAGFVFGGWLDAVDNVFPDGDPQVVAGLSLARHRRLPWRLEVGAGLGSGSPDLSIAFRVGSAGWSRRR